MNPGSESTSDNNNVSGPAGFARSTYMGLNAEMEITPLEEMVSGVRERQFGGSRGARSGRPVERAKPKSLQCCESR